VAPARGLWIQPARQPDHTQLQIQAAVLQTMSGGLFTHALQKEKENKMKPILTRKQTIVFDLILQGKRNLQIAEELAISEKGVKFHKTNIFRLFRVRNTRALIARHAEIMAR
jgi:DNA-binding CsgD family transcriptional regulator